MNDMTTVRARAYALWPYLALGLSRLVLHPKPGVGTMAVTPRWQVLYDPQWVNSLTLDQAAGVLAHELWHLLRRHSFRRETRDPKLWNIACDVAINDDEELRDKLPDGGCYWPAFASHGVRANMLEEDIYDLLAKAQTPPPQGGKDGDEEGDADGDGEPMPAGKGKQQTKAGKGDCGSGAGGEKIDGEDDPSIPCGGGEETSAVDAEILARQVAEAVRSCGSASRGARRWADATLTAPAVPWQKVLRVALVRAIALTRGATDYSYTRSKVRSGVILPRLVRPTCPVAIVLDTSGSIVGPMLEAALVEIDGILKAVKLPCTVLACDSQVHGGAQKVTSASAIKPLGGGGTDMGKGIEAAEALRPKHGAIVVVTDGYTPWPSAAPRGPCIVCLLGASERDRVSADVPAWATKVYVS